MRRKVISYNSKLKDLARKLRKQGNLSEVLLWQQLKGKQMLGYDFHRQRPLGNYIVDFFCHELMLAIEIDGSTHNARFTEDSARQHELGAMGVSMLRFLDADVKRNLNGVVEDVRNWIQRHTPNPSQEGN